MWKKRPVIASNKRKVILLYANIRLHGAKTVKEKLLELKWKILPHPAYSPDTALPDYALNLLMQHDLVGTRFKNVKEVRK